MSTGAEILTNPYEGPNRAHRQFREKYAWLNASCYLLHKSKDKLQSDLREEMEQLEQKFQSPNMPYALGIVTQGISRTEFKAIFLSSLDARKVRDDMNGFLTLTRRQTLIGSHRMIVDFCFDLLEDLITCQAISLDANSVERVQVRALSPKKLTTLYRGIGMPIAEDANREHDLHLLTITRNLLEHRNGQVDADYVRVKGSTTINIGDQIPIEFQSAGDALATAMDIVSRLNQRALMKWPQLGHVTPPHSTGK